MLASHSLSSEIYQTIVTILIVNFYGQVTNHEAEEFVSISFLAMKITPIIPFISIHCL